jgi:hypothetical protein
MPDLRTIFFGALLWAVTMGASALGNLFLDDWETPAKIRIVTMLFAVGAVLAFPIGLFAARLVSQGRRWEVAFAAAFVCLAIATVGMTAGLFALQYRSYYAEWHAPAFTHTWALQFVFTTLIALYQFVVLGIRLYFPVGFVALFAAGVWFARQQR